jgi:oral-facial-digital syndrome 1 protein
VAALHRAEADAETAREEVIPLRVEIERIEYERKDERRERGEALAMAEAFKVRAEVAEKRVDDAVKRAKDAWATVESTKKFMRELMDEEVKKRIYQEQRANALRAAAEIPGVTPEQLGLQRGLIDGANALVDENGEYVSHNTAVKVMMKELEAQHQTQKEALAAYERKLMYERQIEEANAAMDAAKLAANKMRDEAAKKAQIERAVLEAEIKARTAMEGAKLSSESYADAYADDTFEAADEEVAAVTSDAPAVTASPPKSPTSRPKSPVGAKSPKKTSPRVSGEIEEVYEEDFVPDELEDETGDDVF